jgi:hypothetical protein
MKAALRLTACFASPEAGRFFILSLADDIAACKSPRSILIKL